MDKPPNSCQENELVQSPTLHPMLSTHVKHNYCSYTTLIQLVRWYVDHLHNYVYVQDQCYIDMSNHPIQNGMPICSQPGNE